MQDPSTTLCLMLHTKSIEVKGRMERKRRGEKRDMEPGIWTRYPLLCPSCLLRAALAAPGKDPLAPRSPSVVLFRVACTPSLTTRTAIALSGNPV